MSDSVRPHRRKPTRLPCPWDSPGKNTGVGCHFLLQCMKVKRESEVAHSCPTLSDPLLPTRILHLGSSFIILERTWYRFVCGTKSVTLTPIQKTMQTGKNVGSLYIKDLVSLINNFYKSTRKSKQSRKVSKVCDHNFQKRKYKRLLKDMLSCN